MFPTWWSTCYQVLIPDPFHIKLLKCPFCYSPMLRQCNRPPPHRTKQRLKCTNPPPHWAKQRLKCTSPQPHWVKQRQKCTNPPPHRAKQRLKCTYPPPHRAKQRLKCTNPPHLCKGKVRNELNLHPFGQGSDLKPHKAPAMPYVSPGLGGGSFQ